MASAYLQFKCNNGVDLRQNYIDIMNAILLQLKKGENLVTLIGNSDIPKLKSSLILFLEVSDNIKDNEVNKLIMSLMQYINIYY